MKVVENVQILVANNGQYACICYPTAKWVFGHLIEGRGKHNAEKVATSFVAYLRERRYEEPYFTPCIILEKEYKNFLRGYEDIYFTPNIMSEKEYKDGIKELLEGTK